MNARPDGRKAPGAREAEWTPDVAASLARNAGIELLTDRHWKVIAACREEAARSGRTPCGHRITLLTGLEAAELERLFPGPIETLIARIAGLPRRTCVRGGDPAAGFRRNPT